MNSIFFYSRSKHNAAEHCEHTDRLPCIILSQYVNLLTKEKIALCLEIIKSGYSNAFSIWSLSVTHKKSCHVSKLLYMQPGIQEEEIQTISHTLHMCFSLNSKNTYWANRAFMQGITIHEACSERDTAYMLSSMRTLARSLSIYSASCSCVSPAGHWGFQLWWSQISSPERRPCAVFMRSGHV